MSAATGLNSPAGKGRVASTPPPPTTWKVPDASLRASVAAHHHKAVNQISPGPLQARREPLRAGLGARSGATQALS